MLGEMLKLICPKARGQLSLVFCCFSFFSSDQSSPHAFRSFFAQGVCGRWLTKQQEGTKPLAIVFNKKILTIEEID